MIKLNNSLLLISYIGFTTAFYAQCTNGGCGTQLILNPSFEVTTQSITLNNTVIPFSGSPIQSWLGTDDTGASTPDYFNLQGVTQSPPSQYFYNSACMTGAGQVGIYTRATGSSNAREYIQAQLITPLIAGHQYCFSMVVKSRQTNSPPAPPANILTQCDGIGVWFHNVGLIDVNTMNGGQQFLGLGSIINANAQIQNPSGNLIGAACQTISGTFCAQGGENFIVIGNFKDNINTVMVGSGTSNYMYIDDVSLKESCTNPLTASVIASPLSLCEGDCSNLSVSVTGGNTPYTYTWQPDGQSTSAITVCPNSTATYTLQVGSAGACITPQTCSTSVTINVIPPIVVSVSPSAATICPGSSTTLAATGGGTYTWSTTETTSKITVSPGTSSTYTVIVTNGNCTGSATVSVTVVANLVPIITGDTTICNGTSTMLSTSGGGTYLWSDNTTNSSITVSPASTSTYSVTVTSGSCSGTASVQVLVNPYPTPTINGTSAICSGQSATLTASTGDSYSWNPGGQTTGSITVSPSGTTDYIVTVTTNGCSGSASTQVLVNPTPNPAISGTSSICTGDTTTLVTNIAGPYSWSPGGETTQSITVIPSGTTTYIVSVTVNGCTGTAAQTVTVIPPVKANITGNNICMGEIVKLAASGGTNYLWNTGATTSTITETPINTTTYSVMVTTGNCADTASYTVTVGSLPVAIVSGDTTIVYGQSTSLTSSGGDTYQWIPSNGLSCDTCANPIAAPTATTQYCIIIKNSVGCSDSACVIVTVDLKCGFEGELFVPNGFSPNNDGQNDVLLVRGAGITELHWTIFNRWGEKVFETTDPQQEWDGTFKGKQLDPAVFIYYLKASCLTGEEISIKGNVAIIR